jgi:hypothetical protein
MGRRQIAINEEVTPDHPLVMPIPYSGCWIWLGSIGGGGYGEVTDIPYRRVYVHRLAWERSGQDIPNDLCLLHKCDVPACCNPSHLFLGTRTDNMADKVRKGRQTRGEELSRLIKAGFERKRRRDEDHD